MALLVVGIGLAALLGLFPAALREGSLASADTSQSLFADQVLNMLHANASAITNWQDWTDRDFDRGKFLKGMSPTAVDDVRVPTMLSDEDILCGHHMVSDYLTPDTYIDYDLHLQHEGTASNVVSAWLRVGDRKSSNINKNPIYATKFIFMGM
jgi:Tfp pilus assembly protein PilV